MWATKKPAHAGFSMTVTHPLDKALPSKVEGLRTYLLDQAQNERNQFLDICLLGAACIVSRHGHSTPVT